MFQISMKYTRCTAGDADKSLGLLSLAPESMDQNEWSVQLYS